MVIRATAGTPDRPTLVAATSLYRIKTTYSELSRGAFFSLLGLLGAGTQGSKTVIAGALSRRRLERSGISLALGLLYGD